MADDDKDQGGSRSGRYPGVSLGDALAAADRLYKAERHAPVSHDTAVTKMGYKGLSGPARVMIGALRQYGLIEKMGKSQFRLAKLAIEALYGNEEQRLKARATAAFMPPLFQELARSHRDASEDNLRSYLITNKGFIDTGARIAAKSFRETLALVPGSDSGYSQTMDGTQSEQQFAAHEERPMEQPSKSQALDGLGATLPMLSWVLSVPRGVRAELKVTGKDVRRDDLERLKKQIDFLIESLDDAP